MITLLLLARATYVWCCSSRTFRSWWIAHSTQHQRRGCNTLAGHLYFRDACRCTSGSSETLWSRGSSHQWWWRIFPCFPVSVMNNRACSQHTLRYSCTTSGSQTVVREGFSGGTRAAFLSYSKSFVNSFLCCNSFVCYANVANSFICCINLKYIWANYVLLKPGVYTPTLKKHQVPVVRDLKKFENHWAIDTA